MIPIAEHAPVENETDDPEGSVREEKDSSVSTRTETWAEDQQTHGYYYDDSTGYQTFDPDADAEGEADEDRETP